jgi:hypothetical protein
MVASSLESGILGKARLAAYPQTCASDHNNWGSPWALSRTGSVVVEWHEL